MPIDYLIDRKKKIVFATPRGMMTHEDMVAYEKDVWSRRSVGGYGELIDMTVVDMLDFESPAKVMEIAELSASTDRARSRSRIAIVAVDKLHVALGRMYATYRSLSAAARAEVRIFATQEEALGWLTPAKGGRRRKVAGRARRR